MKFTLQVPDEPGAPVVCALCGHLIRGVREFFIEAGAEKFWSFYVDGTHHYRHDQCPLEGRG